MNERDDYRDRRVGEAVTRVPVRERSDGFMPALLARLDEVDAETAKVAGPAAEQGGGLWRRFAHRPRSIVAAAAVAAVLVLVLALSGVPGVHDTEPPPATAAQRLVAAIDAGLAKVHTMRGRVVFDAPFESILYPPEWATFAATSAGDRLVDVHLRPDWARARRSYMAQRASLQKARANYTPAQYRSQLKGLRQMAAMPTRSVWVTTSGDHSSSLAFFSADSFTRRLVRARYFDLGWDLGLHPNAKTGETERLWVMATQLRSVLAGGAEVTVRDTTYQGRPAWRVAVPARKGSPGWYATVDKEYGITLEVPALSQTGANGGAPTLIAFHVTRLVVNEPLPAGTFAIRPSYETAMSLKAHRGASLTVKRTDLTEGSPGVSNFPPNALGLVASGVKLVPATLPPGYRLTEIARHAEGTPAVLVYGRGMGEFVVDSGPRTAEAGASSADTAPAPGIAAFDRATWPRLDGYGEFTRIRGGALNGAPAMLFAGIGAPASLYAWTDTWEASINGDLTRAELLTVAGSLRPVRGAIRMTSRASLLSSLALIVALLAAALTAIAWLTIGRRRREVEERPGIGVLTWPLIGLTLVLVGTCLVWHALLNNGPAFRVSGWDEPLGRVVAALATAAVCGAAWWLLARRSAHVWLRTLAQVLAAAALVGAVFALVYLPLQARFVVSPPAGSDPSTESWLLRIADSQFSPSASTGLYIAILGALVLFVGVLMMRRRDVNSGAPVPKSGAE